MSRIKAPVLNEKHLKALALFEQGKHSLASIAKQVGWSADYMYDLYEGDTAKTSSVATLFSAECRKMDKKLMARIKTLARSNKALAQEQLSRILHNYEKKKKLSIDDKKIITSIMTCLAKSTPSVEVGSVSYSYTKGLTAQQLIHEFTRLQTLADGASNRSAVQGAFEGRQGILPSTAGSGDSVESEQ